MARLPVPNAVSITSENGRSAAQVDAGANGPYLPLGPRRGQHRTAGDSVNAWIGSTRRTRLPPAWPQSRVWVDGG